MKNRINKRVLVIILIVLLLSIIVAITLAILKDKQQPSAVIQDTCLIEQRNYNGREVYVIRPKKQSDSNKVILYFHGGSYMAEMTSKHWKFIKNLVDDTHSTIIIPVYPLAPQYTYKDVFNMVEPLYTDIVTKVNPQNLILMGDSAGGGLCLALEEKISSENVALPSKTILISPWLDVSMSNKDIEKVAKNDHDLNKDKLLIAGRLYAGTLDTKNYLVSPLYGDISRLQNVIIYTGTYDILNPDAHVLKNKADKIGVDIQIKEYDKASHVWVINRNCDTKLVEQGYQDIISEIK